MKIIQMKLTEYRQRTVRTSVLVFDIRRSCFTACQLATPIPTAVTDNSNCLRTCSIQQNCTKFQLNSNIAFMYLVYKCRKFTFLSKIICLCIKRQKNKLIYTPRMNFEKCFLLQKYEQLYFEIGYLETKTTNKYIYHMAFNDVPTED